MIQIQTAPESFVTRPPRILLDDSHAARVSLWRDGEAESGEFPAEMIDISSGGTKLKVATCLRFEESVRLRIEIPSVDLNCYVLASVRHIRPAGEGRWIVGCAVFPPLDEKAVARLAMQSGCDRRRWQREAICLPVTVRRQLALVDTEGTIVNLSTGGFCIQLAEACSAGECIRVGIRNMSGEEYTVMARAQWQLKTAEGFLIGCKFMRADDYDVLQVATGAPNERPKAAGEKEEHSLWPAAALLACAPIAMVVLLETNWDGPPPHSVFHRPPAAVAAPADPERDGNGDAAAEQAASVSEQPASDDVPQQPVETLEGVEIEPPAPPVARDDSLRQAGEVPAPPDVEAAPPLPEEVTVDDAPAQTPETQTPQPKTPQFEMREWIDNTGQFRVVAVLVAVEENAVRLRRYDGRETLVPLAKLSAADAEYIRTALSESKP